MVRMQQIFGKTIVPVVHQEDGGFYFLVEVEPGRKKFVRLLV